MKCLGIETDSSSSSSPVNLDVIDGIITEAGHGIRPGSTNNKRIVTSRSSSSSEVGKGDNPPTKKSKTDAVSDLRIPGTSSSMLSSTENFPHIGNEKDLTAAVDEHDLLNKTFYYLDGIVPFQGIVESCARNKAGILCYTLYFAKDNSNTIVTLDELQSYMLNGPNGSLFGGKEREHIVTEVKACRIKEQFAHLTRHPPSHYQFKIRWDDSNKGVWGDYERSQFTTTVMKKFLKSQSLLLTFKKHYETSKKDTWVHYRVGVKTDKIDEHLKITMANGDKVNKTMREATQYFGKDGINRIKKQFKLLPEKKSRAWFFVNTGLEVDSGAGLNTGEEMLVSPVEQLYSDTYDWKTLAYNNWLKLQVMKTRGKFCILVNSLNILDVSPGECEQIFNSFLRYHTSKGEIDISTCFIALFNLKLSACFFRYTKCRSLLSFGQLSRELESMTRGKAAVVCYETTFGSTHAVCWDVVGKRILDCEHNNNTVFEYTLFSKDSTVVRNLLMSLGTAFDVPCILYVGYWFPRSEKKVWKLLK
jgi:hypothetical protein